MLEQRTLVMIKPECWWRRLIGRVIARFEDKGMKIVAMKLMRLTKPLAKKLYEPHKEKPFFRGLIDSVTNGPVVVILIQGKDAISVCRSLIGSTDGVDAKPGTIRGDFSISTRMNTVHGSDTPENAKREINLVFTPQEKRLDFDMCDELLFYDYDNVTGKLV